MIRFLVDASPFFARFALTFGNDKRGVTMLEYGLIAALIAAVSVGVVTGLGSYISGLLAAFGDYIATH